MSRTREVKCAQYRFTWATRGLDGHGGGFGVVARSADWPTEFGADPVLRDLLTNLPAAARGEAEETAAVRLAHLRVAGGTLLVAQRAVGADGAGRPGNFAVHALFDPTGSLGALDLAGLVDRLRLERDVDAEPDPDAPSLTVPVVPRWSSGAGETGEAGVERRYGDQPVPYAGAYAALTDGLVRRLPADLVNQLQLRPGSPAERPGAVDALVERFRPAVELGAADHDSWWERHERTLEEWDEELTRFLIQNRPVDEVQDAALWVRWDGATERGRAVVATELLRRPVLTTDEQAVSELRRRPRLLDAVLETGVRGRVKQREAAARWVAVAGSDAQAVDLAAELLVIGDARVPAPLADRLQALSPDLMPARLAESMAGQLDAARPMAPPWRERCLRLLLLGQPTCAHPEALVRSADDDELVTAVADAVVDTDGAAAAWQALAGELPVDRLIAVFAAASPPAARHLLHAVTAGPPDPLVAAWPALAGTLGWSERVRTLLPRLAADRRTLRRQRTVLLIVVAALVVAVVVLAVLLGMP